MRIIRLMTTAIYEKIIRGFVVEHINNDKKHMYIYIKISFPHKNVYKYLYNNMVIRVCEYFVHNAVFTKTNYGLRCIIEI